MQWRRLPDFNGSQPYSSKKETLILEVCYSFEFSMDWSVLNDILHISKCLNVESACFSNYIWMKNNYWEIYLH